MKKKIEAFSHVPVDIFHSGQNSQTVKQSNMTLAESSAHFETINRGSVLQISVATMSVLPSPPGGRLQQYRFITSANPIMDHQLVAPFNLWSDPFSSFEWSRSIVDTSGSANC